MVGLQYLHLSANIALPLSLERYYLLRKQGKGNIRLSTPRSYSITFLNSKKNTKDPHSDMSETHWQSCRDFRKGRVTDLYLMLVYVL